jgi:hypothetical protein
MNFPFSFLHKSVQTKKVISDSRIELQFDVEKPVDLVDLALSFQSFSRQYKKFVTGYLDEKNIQIPDEDSVRLYVTKIESNCIKAEMAWVDPNGLFAGALVLMDNANTILEFLKHIRYYLNAFRDKTEIPASKLLGKRDCEDFKQILTPVVKAGTGSLKFKQLKYDKRGRPSTLMEMEYVSDEAVRAMQGFTEKLALMEKTSAADFKMVSLRLKGVEDKIHKADSKRTRDFGVIERICSKAIPIYWISEMDEKKLKAHDGNHFKCSLVVDVNVETKDGDPKFYRVVKLHDILDD